MGSGKGERLGWSYAVEREGYLDVEELFVRPTYRRSGVSRSLVQELRRDAEAARLPLRAWIPQVDARRENLPAAKAVLKRLELVLAPSSFAWARFVATSQLPRSLIHL